MDTSEAGFTKGPWSLFPTETGWIVNQAGGPGYVCTLSNISHRADECQANAQLIVTAPELLAACKAQHKALDILMAKLIGTDPEFRPTKSPAWDAVVLGNDAIVKAEGK